jgi:hypothetical protein
MENQSLQKKSHDMTEIIRQWEQSGQSQKSFCQSRNIAHSKFYYWLKKVRARQIPENQTDFIAVRIDQARNTGDLDIQYPNGVILKLHTPIDLGMVRALLQLL